MESKVPLDVGIKRRKVVGLGKDGSEKRVSVPRPMILNHCAAALNYFCMYFYTVILKLLKVCQG